MSKIIIRQADKSDIQAIIHMQQAWLAEDSVFGFIPDSIEQINVSLGHQFLIAEFNSKIAGFISGSIHKSVGIAVVPNDKKYLEVDNLFVLPQYRSNGIGSALLDHLLTQAKQKGITYVTVYSATKNIHSILRFYESHGFQSWYLQMFQKL